MAQLLFGELSPSGKLPVTFYKNTEDLPAFEDYSMKGRTYRYIETEPLYPFGYGLTYGDVEVSAVSCCGSPAVNGGEITLDSPDAFRLHVKLTNHGQVGTGEVVQVYIRAEDAPDATPAAKLCGFARTWVPAEGEASVTVPIGAEAFTVVNEEGERLVEGKTFTVSVGLGQPDARTRALTGKDCITFIVKLA